MTHSVKSMKFVRGAGAAAAAQTDVVSEIVDLNGYDSILAIAALGDVSDGSVLGLVLEFGDDAGGSDMAAHTDLDGDAVSATFTAGAADADDKVLAIVHNNPTKRYVRARLTRGTADAVVEGINIVLGSASRTTDTRPTDDALDAVDSFG